MGLDDGSGVGSVLGVGKLDSDARFAVTGRTPWSYPDDFSGDGEAFFELHNSQQQENFIAQGKMFCAWHKQAAA